VVVSFISATRSTSALSAKWTYRSVINTADVVGSDTQKAANLICGEGIFTLAIAGSKWTGTLNMGDGYVLDLRGKIRPSSDNVLLTSEFSGFGRANTPTAGWEYDWHGYLAYHWPRGVNRAPALVGTVISANAHDGGATGLVASFIAVKQP
jgi:hypothetical protein